MGSRFYFGNSDDSGSDGDATDSPLPFPKPLARSSFLTPEFDPTTLLSSLSDRFQTLEDLQNELRTLSQSLNKELLDLVNDNYQDFLSLGSTLSGGEEKVEEVRVGLLGFQRELSVIRSKVDARRDDVTKLLEEKRKLKQEIKLGRALVEIAERIEDLEGQLMIGEAVKEKSRNGPVDTDMAGESEYDSFSEDSDDDESSAADGESRSTARKLERLVDQFMVAQVLIGRHDAKQAFVATQRARLRQIQNTLRMDINSAQKQDLGKSLTGESSSNGFSQLKQRLEYET